jgi:hypothetical protein
MITTVRYAYRNVIAAKTQKSANFAHIADPHQFGDFLKGFDAYQGDYAVKKALQFASLTMLRPYNIRFMRWECR